MNNLQSGIGVWICCYVLNALWQVPLLLAAGGLAARGLRRVSTRAEHRVWVAVLLLQAAVPALSVFAGDWSPKLWAWSLHAQTRGDGLVSVIVGQGTVAAGPHLPAVLLLVVKALYGLITLYLVARFVMRCVKVASIQSTATDLDLSEEHRRLWLESLQGLAIDKILLQSSSHIFAPLTMGIVRKVVLLPAALLAQLPEPELRTVLAHELAHARRNDFLKNLLYELLALPVAFHPVVWATRERLTETREMVCDEMAAQFAGPVEYGRSLLRLAHMLVHGAPVKLPHAIGIFDANTLERRLMRLKRNGNRIDGVRRILITAACATFVLAACGSAVAFGLRAEAIGATSGDEASARKSVPPEEMQNNVISKVPPKYPVEAKERGIQGVVTLKAVINKQGSVENLNVLTGPKELQQSALDAVRQWVYKPYLVNGEPVEVETTINVTYSLQK